MPSWLLLARIISRYFSDFLLIFSYLRLPFPIWPFIGLQIGWLLFTEVFTEVFNEVSLKFHRGFHWTFRHSLSMLHLSSFHSEIRGSLRFFDFISCSSRFGFQKFGDLSLTSPTQSNFIADFLICSIIVWIPSSSHSDRMIRWILSTG